MKYTLTRLFFPATKEHPSIHKIFIRVKTERSNYSSVFMISDPFVLKVYVKRALSEIEKQMKIYE